MSDDDELCSDPAEAALLGAAARHPDSVATVLAELPGSDFYRLARGVVWDAMRALHAEGQPTDPVTVGRRMASLGQWHSGGEFGDVRWVVQNDLSRHGSDVTVALAATYAEQIRDLARRRRLVQAAARLRQIAAERPGDASEVLAEMRSELDVLDDLDGPSAPGDFGDGPLGWVDLVAEFEAFHADVNRRPGIPTPWWELDRVLGGLHAGRVYVVGGRPGMGKTTAALVVGMHAAAEHNRQVLVVSREMSRVEVTGRLLARLAEVDVADINARRIEDYQWADIRTAVKRVGEPPITVDAKPRTLAGIKALARAHHHRHGLDLLVVDYLQLIRTDSAGRTREQEVAEVSRQLKELARELDCVVVLPAQLNRGVMNRSDPRPVMSDLRDSGQIEQDADVVILLFRPLTPEGDPTGEIEFIIGKNRHGQTATISLRWHGGYAEIG